MDSKVYEKLKNDTPWHLSPQGTQWGFLYVRYNIIKIPHLMPPAPDEYRGVKFRGMLKNGKVFIEGEARTDQEAAEKATWAAVRILEPEWFEKPANVNPFVVQHVAAMTPDMLKYRADEALRAENNRLREQIAKLEAELAEKVEYIQKMPPREIRQRKVIERQRTWANDAKFDKPEGGATVIIMPGQDGSYEHRQREYERQESEERIEDRVQEEIAKSDLRVIQNVTTKMQNRTPRDAASRKTHAGYLTSPEIGEKEKNNQ